MISFVNKNKNDGEQLLFSFGNDEEAPTIQTPQMEKCKQIKEFISYEPQLDKETYEWIQNMFDQLSHSKFRAKFHLNKHDRDYALAKGPELIERHACEMISERVGPAIPYKDGQQTPWKGHPVFTAQHATGTCCRSCIYKWHHIPPGVQLTPNQIRHLASLVFAWIERDIKEQ